MSALGSDQPDILIGMEQERFKTEPQESEERGNLPPTGTYEELQEAGSQGYTAKPTVEILKIEEDPDSDQLEGGEKDSDTKRDDGFGNKRIRKGIGQLIEEWKHKDPSKDSTYRLADCVGGMSKVTPPSMKEKQNGVRLDACTEQERTSVHFSNLTQDQNLNQSLFQNTASEERFSKNSDMTGEKIFPSRKSFQCTKCEKCFTYKSQLIIHQKVHKGQKPSKCSLRNASFSQTFQLERHEVTNTRKKQMLEMNLQGAKLFQCLECDKSFHQKSKLRVHERIHTGEKPDKCSQSDKSFNVKNVRMHEIIHTGERPYKCSQCDKSFSVKNNLRTHERIHTGERPYKCSQCDKSFNEKNNLRTHERIHTGERPYKCSQCDKSFNEKNNLRTHERIHTGERPYKCSHCDKSFNEKNNLRTHERIHTGERPYKCAHCDKSFNEKNNLRTHERIHTGERPYNCSQCDKCFTHRSNLRIHERIHIGEKTHKYSQCDKIFSQASILRTQERIQTTEK